MYLFFGGLCTLQRSHIHKIQRILSLTKSGMWITYTVSKQRRETFSNKFNVTLSLEYCFYLEKLDPALHECNVLKVTFSRLTEKERIVMLVTTNILLNQ